MSSTGLFSGLYARVREYAELLDDVIIQLKSGEGGAQDLRRHKLAKLLLALNQSPAADLSTQLLAVLVREQGDANSNWTDVGQALLRPEVSPSVLARLEE